MLILPYNKLLTEEKHKEKIEYIGTVEDNKDPLKLGRVKARTALYDDIPYENLPWIYPTPEFFLGNSQNSISFSVPEIGSQVKVYYPTGDKNAPFYKGAEFNSLNKCTFFDVDYPNSYGWKDSKNNFFIVNKAQETIKFQHSSTTNLFIAKDGSYTVTTAGGAIFSCTTDGNFLMQGKNLTINMSENIAINAGNDMMTTVGNNEFITVGNNSTTSIAKTREVSATNSYATIEGTYSVKAPASVFTGNLSSSTGATISFATLEGMEISVIDGIVVNADT